MFRIVKFESAIIINRLKFPRHFIYLRIQRIQCDNF